MAASVPHRVPHSMAATARHTRKRLRVGRVLTIRDEKGPWLYKRLLAEREWRKFWKDKGLIFIFVSMLELFYKSVKGNAFS